MSELFVRAARPADTPTIVRFNVALAEESEGLRSILKRLRPACGGCSPIPPWGVT